MQITVASQAVAQSPTRGAFGLRHRVVVGVKNQHKTLGLPVLKADSPRLAIPRPLSRPPRGVPDPFPLPSRWSVSTHPSEVFARPAVADAPESRYRTLRRTFRCQPMSSQRHFNSSTPICQPPFPLSPTRHRGALQFGEVVGVKDRHSALLRISDSPRRAIPPQGVPPHRNKHCLAWRQCVYAKRRVAALGSPGRELSPLRRHTARRWFDVRISRASRCQDNSSSRLCQPPFPPSPIPPKITGWEHGVRQHLGHGARAPSPAVAGALACNPFWPAQPLDEKRTLRVGNGQEAGAPLATREGARAPCPRRCQPFLQPALRHSAFVIHHSP